MSIETYPAYGRDFAIEGIRQLDQIMVGREIPKAAGIVAVAAGVNLVYLGGTGRGKTELALALPQLISDIHPENVAEVPIQNDLSGMQLIGGASTFTKEMVKGDRTTTEHTHTMLDGVIRPETQVVMIDEINRGSPKTFESLLGMLESRRIVTLEGVREVPNLEFVMATMNPHETYEATQPVAHATISRFSAGAIFDRGGSREERIANVKKIGELPKDAIIEPITDLATIHRMRQDAQKVAMPESMETKIAQLAVNTSDALWEETRLNLDDGEERISTQVRKLARIITILSNETSVNEQAVHNALGLVVAARVGMGHSNAVERGPEIVNNIISSSF